MFFNRVYWIISLFVLFYVLMANSIYSQEIRAEASLDTNTILIGDQIYLNLNLVQPEEQRIQFPAVEDRLPKSVDVLKSSALDTVKLNNQSIGVSRRYLITSFDTGQVHIPGMGFRYQQNGKADSISTMPMNLTVKTVKVDTTASIFDIKGPFAAPVTLGEIVPWLGGGLALIILVLAGIYIVRKFRRKEPLLKTKKSSEPAHTYALRELDKLKEERLWQQDKVKLYYTKLTEILRTYLWMRYGIKTLERTTEEILFSLRQSGFEDRYLYDILEKTLKLGDLVKFARMVPSPSENEESLNTAYDFVNKTRYVPEEQNEENVEEKKPSNTSATENDNIKEDKQ